MGYLTTSALKQAFETALASSLTGYHISRYPHELFPLDSDSRPLEHKAFCVGVLDTTTYVDRARQRPALGNAVATGLDVSMHTGSGLTQWSQITTLPLLVRLSC